MVIKIRTVHYVTRPHIDIRVLNMPSGFCDVIKNKTLNKVRRYKINCKTQLYYSVLRSAL